MEWMDIPPTPDDLNGSLEEYFWVRGGNFNRPIIVRANNGVNSKVIDGERQFRAELNFMFFEDDCSAPIWSSDLHRWPGLGYLEWAGPVARPEIDKCIHGEGSC